MGRACPLAVYYLDIQEIQEIQIFEVWSIPKYSDQDKT
jgi:hypothetical protein